MAMDEIRRRPGVGAIGPLILALIAWLATVLAVAPGQSAAAAEWRSMLAGKNAFLVFSDLHFNPFDDPAIVDRLVASEPADWQSILESARTTGLGPYGKDANYRLVASALARACLQRMMGCGIGCGFPFCLVWDVLI